MFALAFLATISIVTIAFLYSREMFNEGVRFSISIAISMAYVFLTPLLGFGHFPSYTENVQASLLSAVLGFVMAVPFVCMLSDSQEKKDKLPNK